VRHRVARPSFTVEVKRKSPRLPQTVTAAESQQRESHHLQNNLALRHETSARSAPAASWRDLVKASLARDSKLSSKVLVRTVTQDAEPSAKLPPRRILPDLLSDQVAAARLHLEIEQRAARRRRTRRDMGKAGARLQLPEAETRPDAEQLAGREIMPDGETSPVVAVGASEPVQADRHLLERSPAQPAITPGLRGAEAVEVHKRTKDKRAFGTTYRRAERRGEAMRLRPGERWKRRLPEVCR
jgi:hypothetical protein